MYKVCDLFYMLVNRRMDEWVCLARIDTGKGPVEEGQKELESILELDGRERKVTRNLKRKHDEINHVQKVGCLLNLFSHLPKV